jgi:hypothetical protein
MTDRSPYDGKPFYCAVCGAGFGEFMACEAPDCIIESWEAARNRNRVETPNWMRTDD